MGSTVWAIISQPFSSEKWVLRVGQLFCSHFSEKNGSMGWASISEPLFSERIGRTGWAIISQPFFQQKSGSDGLGNIFSATFQQKMGRKGREMICQ